jgi:undecaprenyl-diphosphatase
MPDSKRFLTWLVLSAPLFVLLGIIGFAWESGFEQFFFMHSLRHSQPVLTVVMKFFTGWIHPLIYLIYALILLKAWREHDHSTLRFVMVFALVHVACNVLLVHGIKIGLGRIRPYMLWDQSLTAFMFKPLTLDSSFHSFPSGHSAECAGLLLPLLLRYDGIWKRAAISACLLLVPLSRIYLGKHFPSDIMAGWLIGTCAGFMVHHFSQVRHEFRFVLQAGQGRSVPILLLPAYALARVAGGNGKGNGNGNGNGNGSRPEAAPKPARPAVTTPSSSDELLN